MSTLECGICRDNWGKLVEAFGACAEALVEECDLGSEVQIGSGMAVSGFSGVFGCAIEEVEIQIGSSISSPSSPSANIAANVVLISSLLIVVVVPVIGVAEETPVPIAEEEPRELENACGPGDGAPKSHLVF